MTDDERTALLAEFARLAGAADPTSVTRRSQLRQAYESALPTVPLSRCPFTGVVFTHSLDTAGLDGLWWRYSAPVRAVVEDLPPTYLALTGAVRLVGALERVPFLARIGPAAPFVVPRMLLHEDVKAVVSHVKIGDHDGYPIVYFARPVPPGLERFNTWGADHYLYESPRKADAWHTVEEDRDPLDFDLARWIASGDLFWIAPGDASLRLQSTTAGCPYVGLEGPQTFQDVDDGQVEVEPATSRTRARRASVTPRRR